MKAVALLSGGLDSTLAAKLIQGLGIEITALNFKTPFCLCDQKTDSGCAHTAKTAAGNLGITLKVINISDDFFGVLKNPKHGYGSHMNPCIDCRILKFKKAKIFMQERGADFILTGEVLGQRPMSQHRKALDIIEKESGLEGLVLRPLSARLLPETIPEKRGWVDRNRLLSISGRSRRPQFELANTMNIKDYACPAGGCLLTDPEFTKRIRDLMSYGTLDINNAELLKVGRHFRLSENTRLVVGRNEKENARIQGLAKEQDTVFWPLNLAGPSALTRGALDTGLIELSSKIVCRYCDLNGNANADIAYRAVGDKEDKIMTVTPVAEETLSGLRI
ncbi:MAG: tRNA 4-thiouridine(8) synthase ThiI [Candidatus Omnitrophica bacterium]|nr:tRNA 4-thiouridine(8) synthase ThiI [Candidatus Omnitrophota bacterium]